MTGTEKKYASFAGALLLAVILLSLPFSSCSWRKRRFGKRGIIPEKEMVTILTELYISDGLMTIPKVHYWFQNIDSTRSYYHVLEKHGYSKQIMDKTMEYYFFRNPNRLIKIYEQALGILSEMDSRFATESEIMDARLGNYWTGKDFYALPATDRKDATSFSIPLNSIGVYNLSFNARLFPDDQSYRPHLYMYTCHVDSIETGKRHYYYYPEYIKDGEAHTCKIMIEIPSNPKQLLRGIFIDSDSEVAGTATHGLIDEITLTYTMGIR